jgi:hypothetical protein
MDKAEKEDIEYPFKHGDVLITLAGVSIHPLASKIQASCKMAPEEMAVLQASNQLCYYVFFLAYYGLFIAYLLTPFCTHCI